MAKGSFYKRTISLMTVSLMCQGINLLRDILFARKLGPSEANDIYLLAQSIFGIVINMIIVPLTTAYIPVAARYFDKSSDKERAKRFIANSYGWSICISVVILIIVSLLITPSCMVLAPGLNGESRRLLVKLLNVQTPIIFFCFIRGLNRGNLQLNNQFVFCEVTNIIPYFAVSIYLSITTKVDIVTCCYIFSIATGLAMIPEMIYLKHLDLLTKPALEFDVDVRKVYKLMGGTAAWAAIKQFNILADKAVGTMLPVGSITHLSYASKLTVVVISLISASISLVGFTNVSKLVAKSNTEEIKKEIENEIELSSLLIIPLVTYIILFSKKIIEIMFVNDQYTMQDAEITSSLMRIYAIGVYFFGFQDLLVKVLNAHRKVKSTLIISILNVGTNVALDFLLYRNYGSEGVAFATTASTVIIILPLVHLVNKSVPDMHWLTIVHQYTKTAICAFLSFGILLLIKNNISDGIIAFIGLSIMYFALFILFGLCLKVESLYNMIKLMKSKIFMR